MEIQPLTWQTILELLRQRVADKQTSEIIEARIAITPDQAQLLEIRPTTPLETIRF